MFMCTVLFGQYAHLGSVARGVNVYFLKFFSLYLFTMICYNFLCSKLRFKDQDPWQIFDVLIVLTMVLYVVNYYEEETIKLTIIVDPAP